MKKEMNKRRFLPLLALPLLLLAGCSKDGIEDDSLNVPEQNGDNITFEIGFAPQTRVSTDAKFKSEWENGDEIGIFAVEHGGTLKESGNFIHNVELTYSSADNGTWTASESLWWPTTASGITSLDFYAYYPYNDNATDPTKITFNVKADQSAATDYNKSDLLTAKAVKTDGYGKGETVPLKFSHALAMVQVNIPSPREGFGPSKNLTVTLRGVKTQASVNLADGAVDPTDDVATPIKMYRVEQPNDENYKTSYTYRALVPAQAVAEGTSLFLFKHEERMLLRDGALTGDFSMRAGLAETFVRTLPITLVHTELISAADQTFIMGEGVRLSPLHNVTLTKDFRMSKYEITNAQYAAFLNDKDIEINNAEKGEGKVTYYKDNFITTVTETQPFISSHLWGVTYDDGTSSWKAQDDFENYPVINVTWYGAKAYADWIGGSLPTEAQWEYACRAGSKDAYSYGSVESDKYMWYSSNSMNKTHEVGTRDPNGWGLYDMHGNVCEWCSDWYEGTYYEDESAGTDPTGPTSGSGRVRRGGGWIDDAQYCRSAYRNGAHPDIANNWIGFRVVFVP